MFVLKKKASKNGGNSGALWKGAMMLGYFGAIRIVFEIYQRYAAENLLK
jgi:hypothetical protein